MNSVLQVNKHKSKNIHLWNDLAFLWWQLPGLALWMTQQRLGGHDDQRLAERKSDLKGFIKTKKVSFAKKYYFVETG